MLYQKYNIGDIVVILSTTKSKNYKKTLGHLGIIKSIKDLSYGVYIENMYNNASFYGYFLV